MNKLKILYEDNHIIVVVKPANILTQADNTKDIDMLTIIKKYLKEKYEKPGNVYLGLVHRLDRPVSGVMVFAKTSKAAKRLCEQVKTHEFKKTYFAVATGIFNEKEKKLVDYIIKDKNNNSIISVKQEGKIAKLKYKVLEEDKLNNLTLLQIDLETGRHHQIRIQMANIGHALYGDQRYGKQDKKQIALHAYKIEFTHPVKHERLFFQENPTKKEAWGLFKSVK